MTAAEVLRQIAERNISLVPMFDGKLWVASVDVKGSGRNRKRALSSASALAPTPAQAVERLIERLDGGTPNWEELKW
jgi:hypothetical protein